MSAVYCSTRAVLCTIVLRVAEDDSLIRGGQRALDQFAMVSGWIWSIRHPEVPGRPYRVAQRRLDR